VLGGLWFFLGSGVSIGRRENQEDKRLEWGIWTPGATFAQIVVASADNLCRIDFAIDSYYPWDVPYLDAYLFEIAPQADLQDDSYTTLMKQSKEVRHTRIHGWLVSGHMFNRASFTPIPDSHGKAYLFLLRAPEVKPGGTTIILGSPEERYEEGAFFVNGERQEGDLAFRALYAKSRLRILQQLVERLVVYKPVLFSYPAVYYLLWVGYLALFVSFLILLDRNRAEK
jgi:hypothetical protein